MNQPNHATTMYWRKLQSIAAWLGYRGAVALGFALPLSITAISILLPVTMLGALLGGAFVTQWRKLRRNPVLWVALLLFALLLISMSYSTGTWQDITDTLGKYQKLLYLVLLMPLMSEQRWQQAGIDAFLAAMLVTLAASFLKKAGWLQLGDAGDLSSLFTNHINTSFFMAFAAFILAHRCCAPGKFSWLYGIGLLLTCYHLFFMNEGRTGYVVFLPLLGLFLWQKLGWKGLLATILLVPLLLSVLWISSANFRERVAQISSDMRHYQVRQLDNNSVGLRVQFSRHSIELIKQNPWLGTGVGSFRIEYQRHFPPDPGFANMGNPQNEFFMLGVQLGAVGLLVLLAWFYLQWYYSFALADTLKPLAQGMILAFAVGGWSDTLLYLGYTGYFFIYFTALFYGGITSRRLTP